MCLREFTRRWHKGSPWCFSKDPRRRRRARFRAPDHQRFRRQIRDGELDFRFARHGEEALAALARRTGHRTHVARHQHAGDGRAHVAERAARAAAGVRAMIVSAYGDMANLRTAMNRGAFDLVTKPVDLARSRDYSPQGAGQCRKLREIDRQRAAAERARHQSLALFLAEHCRDAGRAGRTLGAVGGKWSRCCSSNRRAGMAEPWLPKRYRCCASFMIG